MNNSQDMHAALPTAVIVGASDGIGFFLAATLAKRSWRVYGTVPPQTRASNGRSLKQLKAIGVTILTINLTDESTVIAAAGEFGAQPLDMLVNVAGIGPGPNPKDWHKHVAEVLTYKYDINSMGAFLTSKHFCPNLVKASGKIINIASNLALLEKRQPDGLVYRMAKETLNMMTVGMADGFKENGSNVMVLAIHPGNAAKGTIDSRSQNDMRRCIVGMVRIIEAAGMEQSGKFFDWQGEELPW